MYAIIKTGGKQYRVTVGDFIDVELLGLSAGENIEFSDVLFLFDGAVNTVGDPVVPACIVRGEIVNEVSGPKITSVKYKRSHHQYRKFGHRQHYSRVKITEIVR